MRLGRAVCRRCGSAFNCRSPANADAVRDIVDAQRVGDVVGDIFQHPFHNGVLFHAGGEKGAFGSARTLVQPAPKSCPLEAAPALFRIVDRPYGCRFFVGRKEHIEKYCA
jgi:hypothetical protein